MKIAIIGHKRIPSNEGGIEKGVEQHAVRMARLGHQVVVYNRGGHNVYGAQYDIKPVREYKGVRIITVPAFGRKASVPIYSFLATLHAVWHGYDVISYRASGPCVMIPIAKWFGIYCVASLHGIDSQRDKWGGFAKRYLRFGEKMAATKADVCLVLSEHMRQYIKKQYHVNPVVFANGVDEPDFCAADWITRQFGLQKDDYILFLGRIVPEKGLEYLIEAFQKCNTAKKLVIAGGVEADDRYYKKLKKMAGDDQRILFTGYITGKSVDELYSNAYLFCLPSNLEGMSNSLLEAMAFGNCCLVSDIPENVEVVQDKAVRFKEGNTRDLYFKLKMLLDNEDMVRRYKEKAAAYILGRYNWDKVVEQMLSVYSGRLADYCYFADVDKV